jgi:RHS repeat-associated protein
MARTAPAPNIPPIPGMCPSIAVLAGGADGGGGSGKGAGSGGGSAGTGAGSGGENATGDQRGAPDYKKYPECGYASHPVDVVTGRAFTHPITDLSLPGPLPLEFQRMYSSKMAQRDAGLGHGWGHTFGWEVEVGRRRITVWNEQGIAVDFPLIPVGSEVIGPWGWVLRREAWGFAVDADDELWHLFSAPDRGGSRYRLTAIEDRNRNRIALTYDDGRLAEVVDSAGRTIRVRTTREGRIEALEVKNAVAQGRWVVMATYIHDAAGDLISVTDADGYASHYVYDDDHLLTEDADRTGLTFHFRYDNQRRCIESWGDYPGKRDPSLIDELPRYLHDKTTRVKGVHHCKFAYYDDGYSEVDDSTQTRRYFGTQHGTLSKRVEGGGVMTASYGDDGHLLSRTDPMGATTSFQRDSRGRLLQVIDPLGRVTTIRRDAAGLPLEVVDPAGGVTTAVRDRYGNIELFKDAAGATTVFRRDARGLITETVSPTGHKTTFAHDEHGNLILVTLPNRAAWRYIHDAFGRRLAEVDPQGAETRYAYSARGDLIAVHDALGGVTRFSYDGEAHLTQIVDPKGRVTELAWGGYHRLCARRDANGNEVRLRYNLEGELVEVHNERGEVHRIEHDPSGKLLGETTFDGRQLRYRHDRCGRVVRIESGPQHKTLLEYDVAGQLIKRELWDGTVETFQHDALGNLIAAEWPAGEVCIERDAVGRVVREVQVIGGEEHSVEIAYDAEGERVRRTTSLGHVEAIERDVLGARRRTVLDEKHIVEHWSDHAGRETARILPGGGRIESAYDPMGRLVRRRALGPAQHRAVGAGEPAWVGDLAGNVTAERAYQYDWDGELIDVWDAKRGHTRYQYDPVGQLLAAMPDKARAELFRYDPAGNLHEAENGAEPKEYGDGNQLLKKGTTSYRWDEEGRLIEKHVRRDGNEALWQYQWNGAGLMESVTKPDGQLIEFSYDPFARRVQKRCSRPELPGGKLVPISLTRFVWDGDVLVHEITHAIQANREPVIDERTYCFEDDGFEPVAHRDGKREEERWFHYVNDALGTPERLVGPDGTVACELIRESWGKTEVAAASMTRTPVRSPGQYEDEETELCYNRYRYYDPETGRFVSADPVGITGGLNLFGYNGNPITSVDPLGLWTSKDVEALQTGPNGTVVSVKSKKEADGLLKAAFPEYQKVRGVGHQEPSGVRKKRKLDRFKQGGAYHKDYAMSKATGRVCGHEAGNPHGAHPHINIKRTDGVKVEIRVAG